MRTWIYIPLFLLFTLGACAGEKKVVENKKPTTKTETNSTVGKEGENAPNSEIKTTGKTKTGKTGKKGRNLRSESLESPKN